MCKVVVIGASAGGIDAINKILRGLKRPLEYAIVITLHLNPHFKSELAHIIKNNTGHKCIEIEDKMKIGKGKIYISPPNYHTLVEKNMVFSLSVTEKVCFARPSIDVIFESAADTFRENLVGILLTGANCDGSSGLEKINNVDGLTIVQDPNEAEVNAMPKSAIETTKPDHILSLNEISDLLNAIFERKEND